jgi:hypothetical protein
LESSQRRRSSQHSDEKGQAALLRGGPFDGIVPTARDLAVVMGIYTAITAITSPAFVYGYEQGLGIQFTDYMDVTELSKYSLGTFYLFIPMLLGFLLVPLWGETTNYPLWVIDIKKYSLNEVGWICFFAVLCITFWTGLGLPLPKFIVGDVDSTENFLMNLVYVSFLIVMLSVSPLIKQTIRFGNAFSYVFFVIAAIIWNYALGQANGYNFSKEIDDIPKVCLTIDSASPAPIRVVMKFKSGYIVKNDNNMIRRIAADRVKDVEVPYGGKPTKC